MARRCVNPFYLQYKRTLSRGCLLTHNNCFDVTLSSTFNFGLSEWAIIRRITNDSRTEQCDADYKTIDEEEVKKFSSLAQSWWDESGNLKALHTLNSLRIPLVRDGLLKSKNYINLNKDIKSLEGYKILDVGCGGGIVSEPLARLGANVTGIDASEENIAAAKWHSQLDSTVAKNTRYLAGLVEELVEPEKGQFDGVVASEIIEHVLHPELFVKSCCDLAKPGGSIFFTTLNKTWLSWALAVVAAEKILKIVPDGAHDWNKFVSKRELAQMVETNNCEVKLVHGMILNPLTMNWQWTTDTSMNYVLHAIKPSSGSDSDSSSSSSDSD